MKRVDIGEAMRLGECTGSTREREPHCDLGEAVSVEIVHKHVRRTLIVGVVLAVIGIGLLYGY